MTTQTHKNKVSIAPALDAHAVESLVRATQRLLDLSRRVQIDAASLRSVVGTHGTGIGSPPEPAPIYRIKVVSGSLPRRDLASMFAPPKRRRKRKTLVEVSALPPARSNVDDLGATVAAIDEVLAMFASPAQGGTHATKTVSIAPKTRAEIDRIVCRLGVDVRSTLAVGRKIRELARAHHIVITGPAISAACAALRTGRGLIASCLVEEKPVRVMLRFIEKLGRVRIASAPRETPAGTPTKQEGTVAEQKAAQALARKALKRQAVRNDGCPPNDQPNRAGRTDVILHDATPSAARSRRRP